MLVHHTASARIPLKRSPCFIIQAPLGRSVMSDEAQTSATREWLKNHPELVGYMFAIMMAMQSVSTVAAAGGHGSPGP